MDHLRILFLLLSFISNGPLRSQPIYDNCFPPAGLHAYSSNRIVLAWSKPLSTENNLDFIYDNGTAETGWGINPGFTAWLGSEFPIPNELSGQLQSFDLYFVNTNTTADSLTLDIFDSTRTLVASTAPFIPPDNAWITVPANNIPFTGKFYAMVKWNNLSNPAYFLGADTEGPYAWSNLEWLYDGITWIPLSATVSCCSGVFLLRAHALELCDKSKTFVPGKNNRLNSRVNEAIFLQGYNIYRSIDSAGVGTGIFSKINSYPVFSTTSTDYPDIQADVPVHYYTTAVYVNDSSQFICESEPSDTIVTNVVSSVIQNPDNLSLSLFPNPVESDLFIRSTEKIESVFITNLMADHLIGFENIGGPSMKIDLSTLPAGIYMIKVNTAKNQFVRKIMVNR